MAWRGYSAETLPDEDGFATRERGGVPAGFGVS